MAWFTRQLLTAIGFLAALSLTAALAGCTDSRGGPIPYNVSDFGRADSPAASTLPADYQIAPLDTLTITVFRADTLTGDYVVDLMGNVSLPLIGDVKAVGQTPQQFDAVLTQKLGKTYFENPDVSVAIKSSAGRIVTVDGAVEKAGAFPVAGTLTLMQAVALAGGTNDSANAHRVAIFRTIDGQRQAAAFDLVSIRRGEMQDPRVYAGDVVVVDGSGIKSALKRVFQSTPLLMVFRPFVL